MNIPREFAENLISENFNILIAISTKGTLHGLCFAQELAIKDSFKHVHKALGKIKNEKGKLFWRLVEKELLIIKNK